MKKRKRKKRRQPIPPPKLPDPQKFEPTTALYRDDQEGPKGMGRAGRTFDDCLRRPAHRDPLREIDKLTRPAGRTGNA